jgi:hypothetical protein
MGILISISTLTMADFFIVVFFFSKGDIFSLLSHPSIHDFFPCLIEVYGVVCNPLEIPCRH